MTDIQKTALNHYARIMGWADWDQLEYYTMMAEAEATIIALQESLHGTNQHELEKLEYQEFFSDDPGRCHNCGGIHC